MGRPSKKFLGNGEVSRQLTPFLFVEASRDAPPKELIDVRGVASEHAGERCVIFAMLITQPL